MHRDTMTLLLLLFATASSMAAPAEESVPAEMTGKTISWGAEIEASKTIEHRGKDNKYCADEGNAGIKCNRNAVGGWEKFLVSDAGGGKRSLKGGKDQKFCADEGNIIKCNRNAVGGWEQFLMERLAAAPPPPPPTAFSAWSRVFKLSKKVEDGGSITNKQGPNEYNCLTQLKFMLKNHGGNAGDGYWKTNPAEFQTFKDAFKEAFELTAWDGAIADKTWDFKTGGGHEEYAQWQPPYGYLCYREQEVKVVDTEWTEKGWDPDSSKDRQITSHTVHATVKKLNVCVTAQSSGTVPSAAQLETDRKTQNCKSYKSCTIARIEVHNCRGNSPWGAWQQDMACDSGWGTGSGAVTTKLTEWATRRSLPYLCGFA